MFDEDLVTLQCWWTRRGDECLREQSGNEGSADVLDVSSVRANQVGLGNMWCELAHAARNDLHDTGSATGLGISYNRMKVHVCANIGYHSVLQPFDRGSD